MIDFSNFKALSTITIQDMQYTYKDPIKLLRYEYNKKLFVIIHCKQLDNKNELNCFTKVSVKKHLLNKQKTTEFIGQFIL